MFASEIRRKRVHQLPAFSKRRWHVDEVFVKINGRAGASHQTTLGPLTPADVAGPGADDRRPRRIVRANGIVYKDEVVAPPRGVS